MKKSLVGFFIIISLLAGSLRADQNVVIQSDDLQSTNQTITDVNKAAIKNAQNVHYVTNLNVADILKNVFPKFYEYLKKAGLSEKIREAQQITVFAPVDSAFDNLKENMLGDDAYNAIFKSQEVSKLTNILNLHIFPTEMLSTELRHMSEVKPYAGRKLPIHSEDNGFSINNTARSVDVDIIGTNGVVHAIDAVIM
jgi:uncharacterized surface protein with fasciclin (FAS1) repeats